MSLVTTYNYSVPGNFTFDAAKIAVASGHAALLLGNNTGQTYSQSYASSSGFTFNSTFTEFTGGLMRQKDNRPVGFLAYYAWANALGSSGLDGNYGTTTVDVSIFGGAPAVTGGFLDLTGGSNKSVSLSNAATYAPISVATVAFRVKPGYSGSPPSEQYWVASAAGAVSLVNYFALRHSAAGHIRVEVYNSSGAAIGGLIDYDFGAFSPTSGTTYDVVFQLDVSTGATKLFVNAVQLGSTNTDTGTRTAAVILRVGHDTFNAAAQTPNFSIKDLSFYNAIISPANCFLLQTNVYMTDTVTLPSFAYSGVGSVQAYTAAIVTDTNGPRYVLNSLYWNGSAWVSSDNSFAQATTAANIVAHITTLPATSSLIVKVIWQASDTLQMSCDQLTITYTGQIYPTTNPSITPNEVLTIDDLLSFVADITATGSDAVKFYLLIDDTPKYYTSSWVTSDGTYAQTNTAAEILAHSDELDIALGVTFQPVALLHSATGSSTPFITSLVVTYDYFAPHPAGPNFCVLYGYFIDQEGTPMSGATISVINPVTFSHSEELVLAGTDNFTADANGYVDFDIVETETVSRQFLFKVTNPTSGAVLTLGSATVPNETTANLAELAYS